MKRTIINIQEIDRAAWDFAHSDMKLNRLSGMNMFQETLFYISTGLYLMFMNGRVSLQAAKERKNNIYSRIRFIYNQLIETVEWRRRWAARIVAFSDKLTKLRFAVKNEDPQSLEIALDCIDQLTCEDIHLKLFRAEHHSEKFKSRCVRYVIENESHYTDEFGDEFPFMPILTNVFHAADDSGIAETLKELDPDNLRRLSEIDFAQMYNSKSE